MLHTVSKSNFREDRSREHKRKQRYVQENAENEEHIENRGNRGDQTREQTKEKTR
jgi:hypothetical protein